jgi:hypothetical protein
MPDEFEQQLAEYLHCAQTINVSASECLLLTLRTLIDLTTDVEDRIQAFVKIALGGVKGMPYARKFLRRGRTTSFMMSSEERIRF